MRTVLTRAAGILLAGALASSVQAADVRPAVAPAGPEVHKMVIQNGPTFTTRYFAVGLSPSDQAALRDLESAENNADYAADLQTLRRQYVADELVLAPHRADVQQALYGRSITRSYNSEIGFGYDYGLGDGYFPYHNYGSGFFGYGGYGYGGYGYGLGSGFAGSSSTVSQSLAHGVGDEGALKTAMAPVIAGQANSEFAASAGRAYTAALNRAGDSDAMRTALGMPKRDLEARRVVLTLKPGAGDKVEGNLVDEEADWITVATDTGDVSVRKADVVRIERRKPGK